MVDDRKLVAVSMPGIANARIQNFLADVFNDGGNECSALTVTPWTLLRKPQMMDNLEVARKQDISYTAACKRRAGKER